MIALLEQQGAQEHKRSDRTSPATLAEAEVVAAAMQELEGRIAEDFLRPPCAGCCTLCLGSRALLRKVSADGTK